MSCSYFFFCLLRRWTHGHNNSHSVNCNDFIFCRGGCYGIYIWWYTLQNASRRKFELSEKSKWKLYLLDWIWQWESYGVVEWLQRDNFGCVRGAVKTRPIMIHINTTQKGESLWVRKITQLRRDWRMLWVIK